MPADAGVKEACAASASEAAKVKSAMEQKQEAISAQGNVEQKLQAAKALAANRDLTTSHRLVETWHDHAIVA